MSRNFYLTVSAAEIPQQGRSRDDAYDCATREARRFLSVGDRNYSDIRVRLDELIAEGRLELAVRRASADEIEAWDMSFRAMFLLCAWHPL